MDVRPKPEKQPAWHDQDHVVSIPITVTIRSPRAAGRIELVKRIITELAGQGIPVTAQMLGHWLGLREKKAARLIIHACERIRLVANPTE